MRAFIFTIACLILVAGCKPNRSDSHSKDDSDDTPFYLSDWVKDFERSWVGRALRLQSELDAQAPLGRATFLGTHNSYNSHAYESFTRYRDPNQELSIYEQLHLGVRAIEFDVHSTVSMQGWPWEWGSKLLLCHGTTSHIGCSKFDRQLRGALDEVQAWVQETATRPEVLLIYIEDFMDDHEAHDNAIQEIAQTIGPWVYRPKPAQCDGIPTQITKQEILQTGRRILLVTDGCKDVQFQNWVFGGFDERRDGYPTEDVEKFASFPECKSTKFNETEFDRLPVRFFEDRTVLTNTFGDPKVEITDVMSRNLLKCGANVFGWDMLTPEDGRMQQGIWSWEPEAPYQPTNGMAQCAQHVVSGRIHQRNCGDALKFACREKTSGQWRVSTRTGTWDQGHAICASETGGGFEFAVPYSEKDSLALLAAKAPGGTENVWLAYFDAGGFDNWKISKK